MRLLTTGSFAKAPRLSPEALRRRPGRGVRHGPRRSAAGQVAWAWRRAERRRLPRLKPAGCPRPTPAMPAGSARTSGTESTTPGQGSSSADGLIADSWSKPRTCAPAGEEMTSGSSPEPLRREAIFSVWDHAWLNEQQRSPSGLCRVHPRRDGLPAAPHRLERAGPRPTGRRTRRGEGRRPEGRAAARHKRTAADLGAGCVPRTRQTRV